MSPKSGHVVESVLVGPASVSNLQSNSLYKPKAKTIVQHFSPFVSMGSDDELDLEDAGSITEVNQPHRQKPTKQKTSQFSEVFNSSKNNSVNLKRPMRAGGPLVMPQSFPHSPRDHHFGEYMDTDSMTVKAATRANKVFWSPQQMNVTRKQDFNYKEQEHRFNVKMKRAETYKNLQGGSASAKKTEAAGVIRPEPAGSRKMGDHLNSNQKQQSLDMNSSRKKEK